MINIKKFEEKLIALQVWINVSIDFGFDDGPTFEEFYCYWWGTAFIIKENNPQSFAELSKDFKI